MALSSSVNDVVSTLPKWLMMISVIPKTPIRESCSFGRNDGNFLAAFWLLSWSSGLSSREIIDVRKQSTWVVELANMEKSMNVHASFLYAFALSICKWLKVFWGLQTKILSCHSPFSVSFGQRISIFGKSLGNRNHQDCKTLIAK